MASAAVNPKDLHPAVQGFGHGLDVFGKLWNGYEVHGLENIPEDRPSLLVLYHGFFPADGWYLAARFWREHGRLIHFLVDRWLFRVPGLAHLLQHVGTVPGNREDATALLRAGETVLVSPGGVREALAGPSDHYKVLWGNRMGFAHVALAASVDVIPIFTENIEGVYSAPGSATPPFQWLYEKTRLPLVPVMGMGMLPWPVKLRTWIGEPIRHDPAHTPEHLRDRTRESLQTLIDRRQSRPPRLRRALLERFGP